MSDLYSNFIEQRDLRRAAQVRLPRAPAASSSPTRSTAMPEISADGMTYTMQVKPGIYFDDDPAFNGKKRELVADDYVYSIKRLFDPKLAAPLLSEVEGYIVGADEALAKARKANQSRLRRADRRPEGARPLHLADQAQPALLHLHLQLRRLPRRLRGGARGGRALRRRHRRAPGGHRRLSSSPSGSARRRWSSSPTRISARSTSTATRRPDDAEGQAILAQHEGQAPAARSAASRSRSSRRRSRAGSRSSTARWTSSSIVPEEFANHGDAQQQARAQPRAGAASAMRQVPALDLTYAFFNMEDPVVGGYTPEKVALRRAISPRLQRRATRSRIIRKNQAIAAETPVQPRASPATTRPSAPAPTSTTSPRPRRCSTCSATSTATATATARCPTARRSCCDSTPRPPRVDMQVDELWKRSMDDIGVQDHGPQGEVARPPQGGAAPASCMMWQLGGSAAAPDADTWLAVALRPNTGTRATTRASSSPSTTASTRRRASCPTRPSAPGSTRRWRKLVVAYAPWKLQRAPHPHGHVVSVGRGLPPPAGAEQRVLEVRRHRPRKEKGAVRPL